MKYDSIATAYLARFSKQQSQIDEQLLPKEEIDADDMRENGHDFYQQKFIDAHPKLAELFNNSPYMNNQYSKRKFAARIPVELDVSTKSPHPEVSEFLKNAGYHFTDEEYKKGIANQAKTVGNPDKGIPYSTKIVSTKIGSLLDKHSASDEIKKNFTNDPFRSNAKTKAFDLVFTGNHHDIYGSSTGRSYTSCADKRPRKADLKRGLKEYDGNGPAAQKMQEEINNNTFNAYLIPRGGDIDNDVIGRISYKQHIGLETGHTTLFPEGRQYGTGVPDGFRETVEKTINPLLEKKSDIYIKNNKVYNDDEQELKVNLAGGNSAITAEQLDNAHKELKKRGFMMPEKKLLTMVNPGLKYKTKQFMDAAKAMSSVSGTLNGTGKYHKDFGIDDPFISGMQHIKEIGNGLDDHLDASYLKKNPYMEKLLDKATSMFDISNSAHHRALTNAVTGFNYGTVFGHYIVKKATGNMQARNYDEFKNMTNLRDSSNGKILFGAESRYSAIPIHQNHSMGDDVTDHIINTASGKHQLSSSLFRAAHASGNKKHGNLYDTAVHYENAGLPRMGEIISSIAEPLRKRSIHSIAETFHGMQPSTRERFASELHDSIGGKTARQFMEDNKEHLEKYINMSKSITENFEEDEEERDFSI